MLFEPAPKWRFKLFAQSGHAFYVPDAPGWLYRIMQRLVLGLVWERLEPRKPWYERALDVLNTVFGEGGDGWSSTRHWRGRDGR